ncbi:MAG TPA: carboxylesterase family protein [Deltaproteobacteria bacterium]|nr:carboxylesterase family protein [Deltaproteobacteria bacterium]
MGREADRSPADSSTPPLTSGPAPGCLDGGKGACVRVESGELQGYRSGRLFVFRGIPYARAERFGPPRPVPPWVGTRSALKPGPRCPQLPSRLEIVMGTLQETPVMSEDCQVLSVWSPDPAGKRPVMVWIHGGAYVTGGGEEAWYDASRLADEGDVVAVTITHRLGAFGYFSPAPCGVRNPGLEDQLAALAWVQRNIAKFGGDPDNVTVFGQSAGGHAIASILGTCERPPFSRAILQSAPLGMTIGQKDAEAAAREFNRALGKPLRAASVDEMIAAQGNVLAASNRGLAFGPVGVDTLKPVVNPDVRLDVLMTWTLDDAAPFAALMHPGGTYGGPVDRLATRIGTRMHFSGPGRKLAAALRARGQRVAAYEIVWRPQGGRFGACHCVELPLLFGNKAVWDGAPMLGSAPWDEVEHLGRQARTQWAAFARSGELPRPTAWLVRQV